MADLDRRRWSQIEEIYEGVLAVPREGRRRYLADACRDDAALEGEILAMLAADETGEPLELERFVRDEDLADPLLGATIGPWRIVAALGRGGAGAVYRVERCDGQYEQQAALKLLAPGVLSVDAAARLAAERRILARLVHPNIARLMDGGVTSPGTPYLVMEYIDGQPLTSYCDERGLGVEARLRLFVLVCGAVQHAHRSLVVHRDLKPSNIYVSRSGEVKLLDFGIAKLLEDDPMGQTPVTRTGLRPLTLAYAAPEQVRGEVVTTAADVYGLGVVLYELLTGKRPHAVESLSAGEAERAILEREPALPSAVADPRIARSLRGDLDRICLMALRKEPDRRYGSVDLFAADIERFLDGRPVAAQPDTVGYRTRRFVRRNRVAVSVTAGFAALLMTFAVTALLQSRQVAAERDGARLERDKAQRVVKIIVDLFQAANPQAVPEGDKQTVGKFLEAAEHRVLSGLGDDLDLSATMKHVLGQMHDARSDFGRARPLLEQALAESRRARGPDDPQTLKIQGDLGSLLVGLDELPAARALMEDALERSLRTVGERHALTADAVFILGSAHGQEAARPFYERSLAIRRAVAAPGDPDLAITLNALAVSDLNQQRFAEARARFDEAYRVTQGINGGRNTHALMVVNNTAVLLTQTGDLAGAEEAHRRGLALAIDLRGPNSLAVANSYNNLATVYATQGKLEKAREYFQLAYDRHVPLLGPTHSRTVNAARNLGVSLLLLERPSEALEWLDRAVQASVAAKGPDARETVCSGRNAPRYSRRWDGARRPSRICARRSRGSKRSRPTGTAQSPTRICISATRSSTPDARRRRRRITEPHSPIGSAPRAAIRERSPAPSASWRGCLLRPAGKTRRARCWTPACRSSVNRGCFMTPAVGKSCGCRRGSPPNRAEELDENLCRFTLGR